MCLCSAREASLVELPDEVMEEGGDSTMASPLTGPTGPKYDLMVDETKARQTFFKETKTFPMFPCKEERLKWDDYGETIR